MGDGKSFDGLPEERSVGAKVRSNARKDKVVIEKTIPEELPPGWTKEIKIRKKGGRTRRDPYYTDPVSGYVFRSMKDALRYVETGELGRLAFKPKDKGDNDEDSEDDQPCSPAGAKKQKLAENRTSPIISDHSSTLTEVAKDEQIHNSGCMGDGISVSSCNTEQLRAGSESSSLELSEDKGSDQRGGKIDANTSVLSDKESPENGVTKDEIKSAGSGKSKKKKDPSLPRRASKRLAGIPLEPTPELETTHRARRGSLKQSNNAVASSGEDSPNQLHVEKEVRHVVETSKSKSMSLEPNKIKNLPGNVASASEHAAEFEKEKKGGEKHKSSVGSPLRFTNITEEFSGKVGTENNADEIAGAPLNLPLGELWQDPCIAFAIKTLTGISDDNPDSIDLPLGLNGSHLRGSITSEGHAPKEDIEHGSEKTSGCTPVNNIAVPEELAGEVETSNKADEKPGSLDLPLADVWSDPCIEFAIKTLTGAIPLDCVQDYLPQQVDSSRTQESSSFPIQNVGEFCQAKFLYQQFSTSQSPSYNYAAPALPHGRNGNLTYPAGVSRGQQR